MEIGEWSVGKIAPRITQVYAPVELNESLYSMDFEILAIPECRLEIIVQPIKQATLRFKISELKFQGIMRVTFQLNNLFPDASIVSVGFVSDPIIDVAVRVNISNYAKFYSLIFLIFSIQANWCFIFNFNPTRQ